MLLVPIMFLIITELTIASLEGARLHLTGLGPLNYLAKILLADHLEKKMKEILKMEAEQTFSAVVKKYSILDNFYKIE